jgi:hypothetical protein
MSADWVTVGANVATLSRGYRGDSYRRDRIERLTKTQIILHSGRRFRRTDLREVGVGVYVSDDLVPAGHPRLAEIDEARRVGGLRSAALNAVDEFRRGAGDSKEKARLAAAALLAYADGAS